MATALHSYRDMLGTNRGTRVSLQYICMYDLSTVVSVFTKGLQRMFYIMHANVQTAVLFCVQ